MKTSQLLSIATLMGGFFLTSATTHASPTCSTPPVGNDLARGCYVESTVWSDKKASISLWQPHESWRGDWQNGDERKDAAVLVFNKAGQSQLLKQWCKEACFTSGGRALRLPHIEIDGEHIVWLADPSMGSREGAAGDVVSVSVDDGTLVTLASNQQLSEQSSGILRSEVLDIGNCKYLLLDAWTAVTPAKTVVAGGYLVISHPQPIALNLACPDYTVHAETKGQDLERLVGLLGVHRMRQANLHWEYGKWVAVQGRLYWRSRTAEDEEFK
jgi:hypothetical protein